MSFLSVLKTTAIDIGKGLLAVAGIGEVLGPEVSAVNPALGAAISGAAILIEALIPGEGKGAIRKPIVASVVTNNLPNVDQTVIGSEIDKAITALNWLSKLQQESPQAFQQLISAMAAK